MRRKILKAGLILGAIWLLIMAATAPYTVRALREKGIVESRFGEFSGALVNQDFQRAYSFCGEDFIRATSFEAFEGQQRALLTKYGRLRTVKIRWIQVSVRQQSETWRTSITAEFEFEQRKATFFYELRYEAQQWMVYGYKQADD